MFFLMKTDFDFVFSSNSIRDLLGELVLLADPFELAVADKREAISTRFIDCGFKEGEGDRQCLVRIGGLSDPTCSRTVAAKVR